MPTQLEIQHDSQCCVDTAHLFEAEVTHTLAQPTGVRRCRLFSQHPGDFAADFDLIPRLNEKRSIKLALGRVFMAVPVQP